MKKHLANLLKVSVTLVGLALVLREIRPSDIGAALLQADWRWLLLSFLLMSASLVLRAYRWLLLLRGLGATVGLGRLTELYFVGNFFNAFLPSGFGGDVVRVLEATKDVPLDVATGTVFLDRMAGLVMLFVMALVMWPFLAVSPGVGIMVFTAVAAILSLAAITLLLEHNLIAQYGRWLPGPLSPQGNGLVAKVLKAVQACGWRAVLGALAVSVLFNLMLVAWSAAAGAALGMVVAFSYYLAVVPIWSVALLVPSIGGLGVREALTPALFAGAGVAQETAVALSILLFILTRLSSLTGAPVYLFTLLRTNTKTET